MSYQQPANSHQEHYYEAIIVCEDYGDLLAHSLPSIKNQFDRVVVVTSGDDPETTRVCDEWSTRVAVCPAIKEGGQFNKGLAINRGLMELRRTGWVAQIDADIVLPQFTRNMFEKLALRWDCIHGIQRFCVRSHAEWMAVRDQVRDRPGFTQNWFVETPILPQSAQIVHRDFGWCPIGFFQLWHSRYADEHGLRYTTASGSAGGEDVSWALNWPREKRILLPALWCLHLESEPLPMGANWGGRRSRRFE